MKKTVFVVGLSLLLITPFSLTWSDPPNSSGAVIRLSPGGTLAFAWIYQGRMATIGLNVNDFCVNNTVEWEDLDFQLVLLDDRLVANATMDDARTEIYPVLGDIPSGDFPVWGEWPDFKAIVCEVFDSAGGNPLAVGSADVQVADNDALGTGGQAVNAATWMAHGSVMTTDGKLVSFQGQQNCLVQEELSCNVRFHLGRGK